MQRPTIRGTLIGLFVLLGAALCLAVGVQVVASFGEWREARELARSNSARESLARTLLAMGEERTAAYLGPARPEGALVSAQTSTNAALEETASALVRLEDDRGLRTFQALEADLAEVRGVAAGGERLPPGEARDALAAHLLTAHTAVAQDVLSLRVALLAREEPTDRMLASAFQARRYASLLLDSLSLNRAILGRLAVEEGGSNRTELLGQAARNEERATFALELLRGEAEGGLTAVREPLDALSRIHSAGYRRAEQSLIRALAAGEAAPDLLARWQDLSLRATEAGTALLEVLFQESRDRIETQRARALWIAVLWSSLLLLGIAAVTLGVRAVVYRVLSPLGRIQASMMALAQGDLDAPLPEKGQGDEMAAMTDALRVFKANAIRRARLQDERLALHERLQATYRQLRADMEAAGAVQTALLPAPARIGGVRFLGRLRPSHLISGDSFDVLRQPNGAVHFFLVDVAGHGAASALVSVASHYTLVQAIQRRQAGESLAEVVAGVNRDWPDHLPYFTLVMGELRPEAGEGALVQAGHPSPVLLRRGDGVEALGQGGLPVGILPNADYEEIRFPFGPGDRLVVYSDGLTEAEDREKQPFGEERLHELLQSRHEDEAGPLMEAVTAAVQQWRVSEDLDDDMTLLILEATQDERD